MLIIGAKIKDHLTERTVVRAPGAVVENYEWVLI
jgi:hypothetical protein